MTTVRKKGPNCAKYTEAGQVEFFHAEYQIIPGIQWQPKLFSVNYHPQKHLSLP